jgi:glycosyltransferase involved in cell wall biosynthesis
MVANEEASQKSQSQQLEAVNKGQSLWGINVAGHVSGGLGIGEAVRANIISMQSAGIPFVINNLDIPGESYPDYTYVDFFSEDNPYPINLIQLNADQVESFVNYAGSKYFQNHYNIGFWYWEMLNFPKEWLSAFDIFDEIWVGSSYGAEAISALSPIPVIKINPSLSLPRPSTSREELELPKDKFIFLFIFDFTSIFERKNPLATIEAFKKAFNSNNNEDVLLIIKFKNAEHFPTQRDKLLSAIGSEPSIKVIDSFLTKDALYGLIYSCDCYVSLHRSEGFGLTMAEAMFYGKPVIATGYSSNLEFMNVGNSFLVKYNLIKLTEDFGPYKKGNIWADPDVDHAAQLMRYVFENYEQALQVATRGAYEVKSLLSPRSMGNKIKNRLEFILHNKISSPRFSTNKIDKVDSYYSLQLQAWIQTAQQIHKDLERAKIKSDIL